jgi:cytochrome b6-f complex iron-sulfur subunit
MNRRELIQRVLIGSTVLIAVPSVLESCTKSPEPGPVQNQLPGGGTTNKVTVDLSLSDNSVLKTTGGSKVIQNVLIIFNGINYVALSAICTHQGCTVGYDSSAGNIKCPCHGSVYAVSGSVINGPAPSPLSSYTVSLSGNTLTITT